MIHVTNGTQRHDAKKKRSSRIVAFTDRKDATLLMLCSIKLYFGLCPLQLLLTVRITFPLILVVSPDSCSKIMCALSPCIYDVYI